MSGSEDATAEQIVIIRRRSHGEDEHHHGGVWKIAYADFMTAMMAFFLVMWLINATNTETKASVASYFNPIKLTDNTARKKGLEDTDASLPADKGAKDKQKTAEKRSPQAGAAPGDGAATAASTAASEAGKAFRDPFNPVLPAQMTAKPATASADAKLAGTSAPAAPLAPKIAKTAEAAPEPSASKAPPPAQAAAELARQASAAKLLGTVQGAIRQLGQGAGPGVDVAVEGDAIVLSLTDTGTFGMFKIGSADPNDELTRLMQKIAPIVLANSERIIVRGHTDGRRYRNDKNSNWRLSLSRAQSALALLVREGVDEARFERIEAYADRKLRVPAEPEAAANRRIEIVLRQSTR